MQARSKPKRCDATLVPGKTVSELLNRKRNATPCAQAMAAPSCSAIGGDCSAACPGIYIREISDMLSAIGSHLGQGLNREFVIRSQKAI